MAINWRVRARNPLFWAQIVLAVGTPVLAYAGLSASDITSWSTLWQIVLDALSNPYVLGLVAVSVFNAINDPTVRRLSDSRRVMTYENPKEPGAL